MKLYAVRAGREHGNHQVQNTNLQMGNEVPERMGDLPKCTL